MREGAKILLCSNVSKLARSTALEKIWISHEGNRRSLKSGCRWRMKIGLLG